MVRTKQRRTYLPYTFPQNPPAVAVAALHLLARRYGDNTGGLYAPVPQRLDRR